MRYTRFEDLPVWNTAIDLAVQTYELTSNALLASKYSLKDQIERAAVSVSNNIAEGFERGTNKELLAFLYIARGSAGEVRSMLCLLERIRVFASLRNEVRALKTKAESCSKQLKAWARSLQNSDFGGERHVNSKTKRKAEAVREREAFLRELADAAARNAAAARSKT